MYNHAILCIFSPILEVEINIIIIIIISYLFMSCSHWLNNIRTVTTWTDFHQHFPANEIYTIVGSFSIQVSWKIFAVLLVSWAICIYHQMCILFLLINSLRLRDAYKRKYTILSLFQIMAGRGQAIIWNNAGILLIGPLGTNFSEILIKIYIFSFKKMRLKMSSGKWQPSYLGLNVLTNVLKSGCLPVLCRHHGICQQ